jgi:chemotaxis protein MotB
VARKQKQEDPPAGAPAWMTTYGDMVTLLLCFFVMLLSFSTIQEAKFHDAVSSLKGAFGVMTSPVSVIQQETVVMPRADTDEWQQMLYELERVRVAVSEEGLQEDVQLTLEKEGVSIQISSPLLFQPAEARLHEGSIPLLDKLVDALRKLDTEIAIEGHTDNVPISSEQVPSNWELSSARATAVLKYLVRQGLPPQRLSAVGYGEFRPIDSNDTEAGRRHNRRVEIFVRRTDALARSVQR